MRTKFYALIVCSIMLAASGCQQNASPVETAKAETLASQPDDAVAANEGFEDACGLIDLEEIATVQGKKMVEAQSSSQREAAFIVNQCYYVAEENSDSVVVSVYRADPANPAGKNPNEFWNARFSELSGDNDGDKKEKAGKKGKGKKEESEPPEPVSGLGDQAYWLDNKLGGALYVLKGDEFLRVSVGGTADEKLRISKAKTIAGSALKRL